jgi:hypothetical protein
MMVSDAIGIIATRLETNRKPGNSWNRESASLYLRDLLEPVPPDLFLLILGLRAPSFAHRQAASLKS